MSGPFNRRARRALAATTAAALVGAAAASMTVTGAAQAAGSPSTTSGRIATPAGAGLRAASTASRAGADAAQGAKAPGPRALGLPSSGRYAFLLELDTSSTAAAQRAAGGSTATARGAARTQLDKVQAAQSAVVAALPSRTSVLYRTHAVLAGVAVRSNVDNLDALRAIKGVKAVHPIAPKSRNNSYAVPLQGAPSVWTGGGGVAGNTGAGTSIGIVDTGIDYTHANFGGPGTVAAYDAALAADTTAPDPAYYGPGRRVVGGTDLVGDDYNSDPTDPDTYDPVPKPDVNPLDCEGHGSHVAGSAGGSGVTGAGATYTGPYGTSTPFSSMRIGPGMAPKADLYAIRVFGCAGSTDVVTEAYDYAVDPNGDGVTTDHLDVVNLSLGSDFGTPYDADALAADAAAKVGVFSAISSGNAGDIYDIGGSPGTAVRALTVAASVDAQSVVDTLNVTIAGTPAKYAAERSIAFDYTAGDLAGPVVAAPASNETACEAYPANTFTGKVVVVKWTEDDLECGSVLRSGNLANAGAIGFIFANSNETFSAGITGSTVIPGVLVSKSGGDAIKAALAAGKAVQAVSTSASDFTQQVPADDDTLTGFTSRGTHDAGAIKPDVTAVGGTVFSTSVGTGNKGENESGTSMAAPMTAGLAALVLTANPTWNVEQVKADIVNTAGADLWTEQDRKGLRYAPNRVGTGRIQAAPAVANKVLAYVKDNPGAVGVSFGPVEVTGPTTLTKTVTVDNRGAAPATYATSYDAITKVPGVSYVVSPASVTVPAGGTSTVSVTFTVTDPKALTKTTDATRGTDNATYGLPVETLADASGHLLLTPSAGSAPQLRVAVYSAPRPASSLGQAASVAFAPGSSTATVPLTGTGVDQGSGTSLVRSVLAGLELQATSGTAPTCTVALTDLCVTGENDRAADIKHVATGADDAGLPADQRLTYFAIAAQAPSSTPASKAEFDVYVDADGNGSADLVGYNTRLPQGADATDIFVVDWVDLTTGELVDEELLDGRDASVDLAVFDSDVVMLPISQSLLTSYGSRFNRRVSYAVQSFGVSTGQLVDTVGTVNPDGSITGPSFDPVNPGVVVSNSVGVAPLFYERTGDTVTITKNDATLALDKALGVLMVHFHNKAGNKAQVVTFAGPATTPTTPVPPATSVDAQGVLKAKIKAGEVKVTFTAVPAATGTVTFKVAGKKVTKTLSAGKAKARIRLTSKGSKVKIKAAYSGDKTYAAEQLSITKKR